MNKRNTNIILASLPIILVGGMVISATVRQTTETSTNPAKAEKEFE